MRKRLAILLCVLYLTGFLVAQGYGVYLYFKPKISWANYQEVK